MSGTPTDEYDYDLPAEAIAQVPVEPRSAARLLVAPAAGGPAAAAIDATAADLPRFLQEGDVLVLNRTRVLPARLRLVKATGGAVEVLLLERVEPGPTEGEGSTQAAGDAVVGDTRSPACREECRTRPPGGDVAVDASALGVGGAQSWTALVKPGKRVPPGTELFEAGAGTGPVVRVEGPLRGADDGQRNVVLLDPAVMGRAGVVPLPPYIHTPLADPERYQTVYAATPESVAAPTAGLHLTAKVLAACRDAGAAVETVDLAVGLGTFRPVVSDTVEAHVMHRERFSVPDETLDACRRAERVVAVGTTTVRALESAAATGRGSGFTDLFIHGDYPFRVVDALLTNFHLPRSSLLLMVEAFYGPGWRDLYAEALARGYRFLSFGDAMLLERARPRSPWSGRPERDCGEASGREGDMQPGPGDDLRPWRAGMGS